MHVTIPLGRMQFWHQRGWPKLHKSRRHLSPSLPFPVHLGGIGVRAHLLGQLWPPQTLKKISAINGTSVTIFLDMRQTRQTRSRAHHVRTSIRVSSEFRAPEAGVASGPYHSIPIRWHLSQFRQVAGCQANQLNFCGWTTPSTTT